MPLLFYIKIYKYYAHAQYYVQGHNETAQRKNMYPPNGISSCLVHGGLLVCPRELFVDGTITLPLQICRKHKTNFEMPARTRADPIRVWEAGDRQPRGICHSPCHTIIFTVGYVFASS